MKFKLGSFWLVATLGVLSAWEVRLSVFAFLLLVIASAAQTRLEHPQKPLIRIALVLGIACTSVGLYRFILNEAMPGIIEARGRDSSGKAVSFLREILFAQDAMRRYAPIDPDGDRVGSAGLLGELTGGVSKRQPRPMPTPPLAPRYAPRVGTLIGPAVEVSGYLYLVCVPRAGGGWTATSSDVADDERAERRWVAYAWPTDDHSPHRNAYFIDEHENILQTTNEQGAGLRLVGRERGPRCEDALEAPGQASYSPWRGKKARSDLPGDVPSARPPVGEP